MSKVKETLEAKIAKKVEKLAKEKAELERLKGRLKTSDRKVRTRDLVQIGALADMVGLRSADRGFLAGLLLRGAELTPGSEKYEALKVRGDRLLLDRAAENEEKRLARKKEREGGST